MYDYDVIVVGGGISGLLSALALGKQGTASFFLKRQILLAETAGRMNLMTVLAGVLIPAFMQ